MRLLRVPGRVFNKVAYTGPVSLLTVDIGAPRWTTRLWDLTSDSEPVELTVEQDMVALLAFRHGGMQFLRTRGLWPPEVGLPAAGDASRVNAALALGAQPGWLPYAFTPDGATLIYTHAGRIDHTYQTHFHLRTATGVFHRLFAAWGTFTTSAAFSPSGRLAALSNGMRIVSVWDVGSPRELFQLEQSDKVSAVAFTSDERLVVAAGRSVRLWDVTTGESLTKFRAFRKFADALAVSHDQRVFAAGSRDGLVRVWDSASGRELSEYEWPVGEVRALAFSPDGSTAAVAGYSAVAVWDLD